MMLFNSAQYFLFLPIVYLIYYFAGERARWIVLLAASILFYAAVNVPYLLVVLLFVAAITYCFGIWLDRADSFRAKRALLWSGIAANVLTLVALKYLPFISENIKVFSALLSLNIHIQQGKGLVAIGVSYYVFQAISYLTDIYLEKEKPETHFGYFALYLAFFPKLLQGPIERYGDLIGQLKNKYAFNYDNMRFGALLFTWGLFKKVVIADRLGPYSNVVFDNVHSFTGLPLLLATYTYAFQIYMDFSGYTDMALGSALLFNIKLTQNFNSPFIATSIADFWRRWHISFCQWILDYIFKPLQIQWRNRGKSGTAAALIVTFLVSGIWHGASWGFVIWGLLQGVYLACSVFYRPYQIKFYKKLGIEKAWFLKTWQIFVTFHLVCFSFIFFRAHDVQQAVYIICHMFNGFKGTRSAFLLSQGLDELIVTLLALFIYAVMVLVCNYSKANIKIITVWNKYFALRWICYNFFIIFTNLYTVRTKTSFIYFQF
jgi:alginate O-acetyltransferase complex protein AlgI